MPDLQAALCRKAAPLFISGRSSRTPLRRGGRPLPCNPVRRAICFFPGRPRFAPRLGCPPSADNSTLSPREEFRARGRETLQIFSGRLLFRPIAEASFNVHVRCIWYAAASSHWPILLRGGPAHFCLPPDRGAGFRAAKIRGGSDPRRDSGSGYASASGRRTAAYSSFRLRPV